MKIEAFEHNLRQKTVPFAYSVITSTGSHVPMVLTYDKEGIERASKLDSLFSYDNKEIMFKVLAKYLDDVEACAYVLICEAYMKKVSREDYENKSEEEFNDVIENTKTNEVLTITWEYRNETNKSGIISTPIFKNSGIVEIDYENTVDRYDEDGEVEGRATSLL